MSERLPIKVFISSPGDVEQERVITSRIIKRLNEKYSDYVDLNGIYWEHEPLMATDSFQKQIIPPSKTDIAVCILWSRLGTRLPRDITREDGSRYNSGTEFEFEDAFFSKQKTGLPDLLVYRKTSQPMVSLTDEQELIDRMKQKKALDQFIDKWFVSDDGSLVAAFHPFTSGAQFEELFEVHLAKLIEARIESANLKQNIPATSHQVYWQDNPFRGLEVFEYEHAEIFFGRTRAIEDILNQLRKQRLNDKPFIVVYGMSGSGKSSVIRAGVVPLLTRPGIIEGVSDWRRCYFRPSDNDGDIFLGLASALTSDLALPELVTDNNETSRFAKLLESNPEAAVIQLVSTLKLLEQQALQTKLNQFANELDEQSEQYQTVSEKLKSQPPVFNICLVLDQLEELFTYQNISEQARIDFFNAIEQLCASNKVWIIASLRSDFYSDFSQLRVFESLRKGDGQLDLYPPSPNEIYQMIRLPASAAGLSFDERPNTGERLDDTLRDAASEESGSLPVLQFTLAELYDNRTADGLLTYASYDKLGGLEGALAVAAETLFSELSATAKASFPTVFRQLVNMSFTGETVTKAIAILDNIQLSDGAKELIDAFVNRRLFVADQSETNQSTLQLAHEALFRAWPRLQEWLENDRELLKIKSRLEYASKQWQSHGRDSQLLFNEGKPIEDARSLIENQFPLTKLEEQFIAQSEASINKRRRTKQLGIVLLGLFGIFASIMAYIATQQREAAEQATEKAIAAEQLAQENEELSLFRLSQVFSNQGYQAYTEFDAKRATVLLGAAWQYDQSATNEYLLASAYNRIKQEVELSNPLRQGTGIVRFSPDNKWLVVGYNNGAIEVWNTATDELVKFWKAHDDIITDILFTESGNRFFTVSADTNIHSYDITSLEVFKIYDDHFAPIRSLFIYEQQGKLISASHDNRALVWDMYSGEILSKISFPDRRDIITSWTDPNSDQVITISSNGIISQWNISDPNASEITRCQVDRDIIGRLFIKPNENLIYSHATNSTLYQFDLNCNINIVAEEFPAANLWYDEQRQLFYPDDLLTDQLSNFDNYQLGTINRTLGIYSLSNVSGDLKIASVKDRSNQLISSGFQSPVNDLVIASNGEFIAAIDNQGQLRKINFVNDKTSRIKQPEFKAIYHHQTDEYVWYISDDSKLYLTNKTDWTTSHFDLPDEILTSIATNAIEPELIISPNQQVAGLVIDRLYLFDIGNQKLLNSIAATKDSSRLSTASFISNTKVAIAQLNDTTKRNNSSWFIYDTEAQHVTIESQDTSRPIREIFNIDDDYYLLTLTDRAIQLWYAQTGDRRLNTDFNVASYAVAPDLNRLAVGFNDGQLHIMRYLGSTLSELTLNDMNKAHSYPVVKVAWGESQTILGSLDNQGTLRFWDVNEHKLYAEVIGYNIVNFALSADERYASALTRSGALLLFDSQNGQLLESFTASTFDTISFNKTSQSFIATTESGDIHQLAVPNLITNKEFINDILRRSPWGFANEKVRPEDQWLELALLVLSENISAENEIALSNSASYLKAITAIQRDIEAERFFQAKQKLNNLAAIYQTTTEAITYNQRVSRAFDSVSYFYTEHKDRIESGVFKDSETILTTDWLKQIHFWNATSGNAKIINTKQDYDSLIPSDKHNVLIGSSIDFGMTIWSLSDYSELVNIPGLTRVALTPDQNYILGRDEEQNRKVYDINGNLKHSFPTNTILNDDYREIANAPTAQYLAVRFDKEIAIYRYADNQKIYSLDITTLTDESDVKFSDLIWRYNGTELFIALNNFNALHLDLTDLSNVTVTELPIMDASEVYLNQSESHLISRHDGNLYSLQLSDKTSRQLTYGYIDTSPKWGHVHEDILVTAENNAGLMVTNIKTADIIGSIEKVNPTGYSSSRLNQDQTELLIYDGTGLARLHDISSMGINNYVYKIAQDHHIRTEFNLLSTAEKSHNYSILINQPDSEIEILNYQPNEQLVQLSKQQYTKNEYSLGFTYTANGLTEITTTKLISYPNGQPLTVTPELQQQLDEYIASLDSESEDQSLDEVEATTEETIRLIRYYLISDNTHHTSVVWQSGDISVISNNSVEIGLTIAQPCEQRASVKWYENLLSISCDDQLTVYDAETDAVILKKYPLEFMAVNDLKYDASQQRLLLGHILPEMSVLIDTSSATAVTNLPLTTDGITSLAIDHEMGIAYSIDFNGIVRQFNITDGKLISSFASGQTSTQKMFAVNARLVLVDSSGYVDVWDPTSKNRISRYRVGSPQGLKHISLQDKQYLLTIDSDAMHYRIRLPW